METGVEMLVRELTAMGIDIPDELINKSVIKAKLNFTITVAVGYYSNEAALDNLETLLLSVLAALPANYVVGAVDRPSITQVGASDLLVADFNVSTYYTN